MPSFFRRVGKTAAALGTNVAAFLASPTSANLRAALTDETGGGAAVFANSPALTGNPTVGSTGATGSLTIFATDDGGRTTGTFVVDVSSGARYGTYQGPSSLEGVTCNASGVPTGWNTLFLNYYATALVHVGSNGNATAALAIDTPLTTVTGSSSGVAYFVQPMQGDNCKKVLVRLTALTGTASFTFPSAFQVTPVVLTTNGLAAALVTAISTTAMTVTGTNSTGILIVEGI